MKVLIIVFILFASLHAAPTIPCRFFLQGKCTKSDCTFLHKIPKDDPTPTLRKLKHAWRRTTEPKDESILATNDNNQHHLDSNVFHPHFARRMQDLATKT